MRDEPAPRRVSTLELFFDLVFVFTITELTQLLAEDVGWTSLWHVMVLLAVIYWMYDGYAWLTNNIEPDSARVRILLLGGMAGYLVIALAVPEAFGSSALAFALAYLLVVWVHAFLYTRSASDFWTAAVRGIAPYNLVGCLLLIVGAAVGGVVQDAAWIGFVVLVWGFTQLTTPTEGFDIRAAHFIERHGLLVIVAIGESVVAVGIGAAGQAIDVPLVLTAALGLALSAGLWWAYFGSDDDTRAEAALGAIEPTRRPHLAVQAFGYAHYVLLLGIILVAVGTRTAVAHPGETLDLEHAAALAGGVTVYLLGDVAFRNLLGLGRSRWRLVGAVAVLLGVPAGVGINAAVALAVTALVLVAALVAEARSGSRRAVD